MNIDELVRAVDMVDGSGFTPNDIDARDIALAMLDKSPLQPGNLMKNGFTREGNTYYRHVFVVGRDPEEARMRVSFDKHTGLLAEVVLVDGVALQPMPITMGALLCRMMELNTERSV
jgi:hypothetical protein